MQVNEAKLSNSLNRPYILASILGKKAFRGSLTDKKGFCHSSYGLFGTWKKQIHMEEANSQKIIYMLVEFVFNFHC